MTTNDNDIFREVYKRVTGDLDIGRALTETRSYLRTLMPLDEIILFRLKDDDTSVHLVFRVTAEGIAGEVDRLLLLLDDANRHAAGTKLDVDKYLSRVFLRSDIEEIDTTYHLERLGLPASSDALMLFNPKLRAGLIALSHEGDVYGKTHIRLFEQLREPFEIAITNAIEYIQVKKVRDSLVDDNQLFREATVRLTGEPDIGTAFHNTLRYLKSSIPLDHIILSTMNVDATDQQILLRVSEHGASTENEELLLTELSQESREGLRRIRDRLPETFVRNIDDDDFDQTLLPAERADKLRELGLNPDSVVLIIGAKSIQASIVFVIENRAAYTPRHLEILHMLKEPFIIALHNAIHTYELERIKNRLIEDNQALHKDIQREVGDRVIGMDQGLKTVMTMVSQVAKTPSPVLLLGETGSGKEVVATALHRISDLAGGPFISLNCGAIPETLIDSELFGHERGAFTGANERKRGRFERADGGTLFLDEVGELPPSAQVKLLRVIQEREFERVGGSQSIRANVRLIAATNRDLPAMVRDGRFREDLWFRLNVFPIEIPPLRERKQDIPALAYFFIQAKSRQLNLPFRPTLPKEELEKLVSYDWPGNVRELQNAIERALILSRGNPLRFPYLETLHAAATTAPESAVPDRPMPTFDEAVASYLRHVLDLTGGRIAGPRGAAVLAGLNPSTFRSKMRKFGVAYRSSHVLRYPPGPLSTASRKQGPISLVPSADGRATPRRY